MRTHRRIWRRFGRIVAPASATVVLVALVLGALWYQGTLKHWLQGRAVEYYLRRVQPHLPFRIEEIEADAPFRDLLHGRIKSLAATLRWQNLRMRVSGPIEITRPSRDNAQSYVVDYRAQATVEQASFRAARSTPFTLHLYARAPETLSRLSELELDAEASVWRGLNATVEAPKLTVNWKDADPTENQAPELRFDFSAQRVRAFLRGTTVDLPLARFPIQGLFRGAAGAQAGPKLHAKIGASDGSAHSPIVLDVEMRPEPRAQIAQVSWSTPTLPIRETVEGLLDAFKVDHEPILSLAGTFQSQGTAELQVTPRAATALGAVQSFAGSIRLRDAAFRLPRQALAARGVRIDLPFSSALGAHALIEVRDLYYRHAHGQLEPTEVSLEPIPDAPGAKNGGTSRTLSALLKQGLRVHVAQAKAVGPALVPLKIDGVPLELGGVTGTVLTPGKPFELATFLKLPPVEAQKIAHPFCVKNHDHLPPAKIEADLPAIRLGWGMIDPDGEIDLELFDGEIRASAIGLYELGTDFPELDFDLDFDGIQLEQLCAWSGFGQMIGSLQGHAHDVTFQGWLPTHFDFGFDAVPRPHASSIEMDPEAMHNLISLFGGEEALDRLPVIAHGGLFNKTFDPFFGWLSRRLSGFDLGYFGVSLFSSGGAILMETHDPPDLYRLFKKHYIFWGHRFKMPLQSVHYPVVMDEHGVARIFQFMSARAQAITQSKRDQNAREHDEETDEHPEENSDENCQPPAF